MSKDSKSFQDKLKQFFRINKGSGPSRSKSDEYVILTDEVIAELKPENPLNTRVKVIREIAEVCKTRRAENRTTEKIWILIHDMFRPEIPKDIRHLVFGLFTTLCQCQLEKDGYLRSKFFIFIKSHEYLEDAGPRFQFLKALTENGRDLSYFDEKIGPLILSWMAGPQVNSIRIGEFMSFLANIIKFNQSFLDQDVLIGIIQNICFISCTCSEKDDVHECLHVLGAVICYASLPAGSLATFLATLCRTVNVDPLCQTSWKIMRNLLGTHLGHSGLFTMCNFMETADRSEDVAVIRGAVFFVGVVLWGSKMIRSLKHSPNTVLSSFVHALEHRHPLIAYEVMMRIQDLVKSNGENLPAVSWDLVLKIINLVSGYSKPSKLQMTPPVDPSYYLKITKSVNETLDAIERIMDAGLFCGSKEKFFEAVDMGIQFRSEESVDKLLQHKVRTQILSSKPGWFNSLAAFSDRHFKHETRVGLRIKALGHIAKVCLSNRGMYEEDLIDKIILPQLKNLETENDHVLRRNGVQFLIEFLKDSSSKKGHDLLLILERIVNKPYETQAQAGEAHHIFTDNDIRDVLAAIEGLVQLFQKKIYHLPSSIAVTTYKILVRNLTNHYKKPVVLESCTSLRYMIFECFFRLRANSMYHLGFPDRDKGVVLSYSSYLAVDHRDGEKESSSDSVHLPPTGNSVAPASGNTNTTPNTVTGSSHQQLSAFPSIPTVTYVSLTTACKLVVQSLKKEKDWKVLELILRQIPFAMENKALILSRHGNDIEFLATALCAMVSDKSLPEALRNCPIKFARSDFHSYLFPILTALVSYHSHLESSVQLKIVKCLEYGLMSKCSRICILSLSICTLEMKDTMHKLLPEVLLSLSKISPKVNIAIPVLEFLSTLIHLPRVFASFVQDQYMSIFAIALPYTNPFKFNQYTVSLAHHVIAMWFLKCRLSFRRDFVSYIIKGLEANVWAPFEEESKRTALELRNEDSSNRKRSSSLTEQSQRRRERPISGHGPMHPSVNVPHHAAIMRAPHLEIKPAVDQALMTFHKELTETCVDLMARYAFADCSALPTRFPSTNFLLSGGNSQTWMVDSRIITITTSGCTQKELRDGLCDKCWLICRKQKSYEENNSKSSSQDTPPQSGVSIGRTHSMKGLTGGNSSGANNSDTSLNYSSSLAARRRHRSAYATAPNSAAQMKRQDCSSPANSGEGKEATKDDLHLEHKLQLSTGPGSEFASGEDGHHGNASPFFNDLGLKQKGEPFLCTCWCQGWAEVHIRRPTGNTSWMMRIQNSVGNYASADMAVKELSAIYFQNLMETSLNDSLASSPSSSALSSPTHHQASQSIKSSPMVSQDSVTGPMSPKTPDSPTETSEDRTGPMDILRKNPVRRSNSSPEMTTTWKNPMLRRQGEIEEQDEEDMSNSTEAVDGQNTSQNQIPPTTPQAADNKSFFGESTANGAKDKENVRDSKTQSTSPPLIQQQLLSKGQGSTSPFRSHETIPEEVLQRISPMKRGSMELASPNVADSLGPIQRERMFTISVMSPARRNPGLRRMVSQDGPLYGKSSSGESGIRSGVSPSFIFLELCSQGFFGNLPKPFLLANNPATEKSLKVIDYIPPYETHKIGVVYVGPGQNETAILQNQHGSLRYRDFLQGLGSLVKLQEIDPQKVYVGGLSRDGSDGDFACIWQDDVMQVMFHVATMMPNKPSDPLGTAKKCHIGNDYVAIVYNNSEEDYDISTIKGQFLYACVIIQPLDHKTNRVIVKVKPILSLADNIGHTEPKIVSDQNLPIMVRQLALHCNLASVIFQRMQSKGADPYASNWLERLRAIKRLRSRLFQDNAGSGSSEDNSDPFSPSTAHKCQFKVVDFTEYV